MFLHASAYEYVTLRNHKLYLEKHEKLVCGIDNWRKSLAEVKIQRRIFKGDVLSKLVSVMAMVFLNYIVRKCAGVYTLTISQERSITECIRMTSNCSPKI